MYLIKDDSTVAIRPVKLGLSEGAEVSIEDGLQAGERVVTDGAEKLTEGMKVTVPGAAQNPGAGDRPRRRNLQ